MKNLAHWPVYSNIRCSYYEPLQTLNKCFNYLFKHGRVWMRPSNTVSDEALGGSFDLSGDNPASVYNVLPIDGLGKLCPLLLAGLPEARASKPEVKEVCTPFLAQEVSEQLDAFLVIEERVK